MTPALFFSPARRDSLRRARSTAGRHRAARGLLTGIALLQSWSAATADGRWSAYYTGDTLGNVRGGIESGTAHLADAGLHGELSGPALLGGGEGTWFATVLWNNASTFSPRYSGDFQVASNIDAPGALRVFELGYEQRLSDDLALRVGLYDLNSEFDVIDSAGLFIHSSHGIGAEIGQAGRNGPSIFPVTSLGLRLQASLGESGVLRYALLDGVPGDPNDPASNEIDLGGGDGVLHALEYSRRLAGGPRLTMGGWLFSARFPALDAEPDAPAALSGNGGVYASIDAALFRSPSSALEVRGFARAGVANEDINPLRAYVGAGAVVQGLLRRRPNDRFGLAVASGRTGSALRRRSDAQGVQPAETSVELTWSAPLTRWLTLQPSVQYIAHPGFVRGRDNALVIALRFTLSVSSSSRMD